MDHFFSEMKRICKPGGVIIISTPDWLYNTKNFYDEFTHCTPFTSRSIGHCLQMYGINQVKVYSLIPLPITWNNSVFRLLANITNLLSLPRKWGKWFRWSQERQLIAYGRVLKNI
jgi:SAM-dependent methyltransferase